jgi:hypothetical protein
MTAVSPGELIGLAALTPVADAGLTFGTAGSQLLPAARQALNKP